LEQESFHDIPPEVRESWKTRLLRWKFNLFPALRGTGGRIEFIASDYSYIRVRLPLNWRTRNYVGTIFGGSIYGAIDPIYMVMFILMLGKEYVVWDRAAQIDFLKPGRSTLRAAFRVSAEEIAEIKEKLEENPKLLRDYSVELRDEEGVLCAKVVKTLYFAKK
jgi:acyl-coenzyme A thioesterase PaaI-like protein